MKVLALHKNDSSCGSCLYRKKCTFTIRLTTREGCRHHNKDNTSERLLREQRKRFIKRYVRRTYVETDERAD